ncbi:hypothetical protein NP493_211g03014 [Ridgeia piscesae]|uniref:G-protein coupled receptors family 1 profile domain-containing protein n=1 Tax=Ridgeia piscesae TaxID=27915 RepID=A0AAD9P132_RIDPI|nr:hypothetical protein NP493_211g03014 [Ridgeia piscesae]
MEQFNCRCVTASVYNNSDVPVYHNTTQVPVYNNMTQVPVYNNVTQVPVYNNTTQVPVYNSMTQVPVYHNTTQVPDYNNMTQVPVYNNMTQVPVYNNTTQVPVYNNTTQVPDYNSMTQVPIYQNTTQLPDYNNMTQVPVYNNTTQVPVYNNTTQVPVYNNMTQVPDYNNVPQVPDYNNTTQVPVYNNMTQVPDYNNVTQVPDYNNTTQVPVYNNTTQVPVYNNVTQVPDYNNTTQVPVYNNTTQVPVYNNTTQVPVYNNATQVPVYNNATQVPVYNNSNSKMPVYNKSLLSNHIEMENTKTDVDRTKMAYSVVVALLMPGNLLVIAVYVRRLTTSIRLYMFGLAVSDMAICINSIILGGALFPGEIPFWLELSMVYVYDVALFYSAFILALISIERYLSVRSTTTFTFSGRRAQTLMTVLAGVSLVSSGFMMIGRHVPLLYSASKMYVAIVIICAIATVAAMYVMMTHQMWVRVRHLRTIGTGSLPSGGATSTATASMSSSTRARAPPPLSAVALKSQRQTAKGMRVLLVITIVFVVCYSPLGVSTCGVRVPSALLYLFIVNSVINPFVYSFMSSDFRRDVHQLFRWAWAMLQTC